MKNSVKSCLTAVMLSSVAIVPVATVSIIASTTSAYAKSDNAGGKGKGKGAEMSSKSKSSSAKLKKKGGSSSSSAGGKKHTALDGLIGKLTGKDKKATRRSAASTKPAKGSGMHPSELGNMNGALNANINAVLAHIKNGNTNGPVGHLAALAVASSAGAEAAEFLATPEAQEYIVLDDAIKAAGYENLEDYQAAVEDDPENADINVDLALAGVGASNLDKAVDDAGYVDLQEYLESGDDVAEIETALDNLGVVDPTVQEEVAAAEVDGEALASAEDAILEYWNKNPGGELGESGRTEAEEALLEELNDRLIANESAIAEAVAAAAADESDDGEYVADDCDEGDDCSPDEELAAVTE